MASRLIKDKGVLEFIEAAKIITGKYKNIEFILLGDKENSYESSKIYKIVKSYQTKKIINYFNFKENIYDYLYKSHCVILPSYREGLSKILIESMSIGRPVITTNVPGCKELVRENGFLVSPRNTSDLVNKIEQFIKLDFSIRRKMCINSRRIIEKNYKIEFIIQKYLNIIEKKIYE